MTRPIDDPANRLPDGVAHTRRFALERHAGPYEQWPSRSRLLMDGKATATRVPGYVLLHQFQVDGGWLLVTDDDCPFEEATAFTLLDERLRIVGERKVGWMYGSFLLTALAWTGARTLVASFGDDFRVRVTLRPWGIPLLRPRLGLRRVRDGPASPRG